MTRHDGASNGAPGVAKCQACQKDLAVLQQMPLRMVTVSGRWHLNIAAVHAGQCAASAATQRVCTELCPRGSPFVVLQTGAAMEDKTCLLIILTVVNDSTSRMLYVAMAAEHKLYMCCTALALEGRHMRTPAAPRYGRLQLSVYAPAPVLFVSNKLFPSGCAPSVLLVVEGYPSRRVECVAGSCMSNDTSSRS